MFVGSGVPRQRVRGRRGDVYLNRDSYVLWIKTRPLAPSAPADVEGWVLPPPISPQTRST